MSKKKYKYTKKEDEIFLICPECGEELSVVDIESFMKCSYCNYSFQGEEEELEDFLLSFTLRPWVAFTCDRFPRD
jgi:uncharacterized CHY-type Zn-finger protein